MANQLKPVELFLATAVLAAGAHGAIASLLSTYRGWSLLPKSCQVLEGNLLRQYGWNWLQG